MKEIFVWMLLAVLVSCNSSPEKKKEADPAIAAPEGNVITPADGHTARNSLDWAGTYRGTLPCADCEGIETEIELNTDSTFRLRMHYIGREVENSQSGTWTWIDGSRIRLRVPGEMSPMYFVAEGKLIALDGEGKRIEGQLAPKFELKKIK